MTLKDEYEKQYKQTVELLKLLGRVAGVSTDLQLSAFRRSCQLAVAYGKVCSRQVLPTPADSQNQPEKGNENQ